MTYRNNFFCACVLFAACSAALADGGQQQRISALVRTQLPKKANIDRTLVGYGRVTTDVGHTRNLSAPLAALVTALNVGVGTPVAKGQTLLVFETAPETRAAYRQAASALANARDELKRVESQAALQLATQSQVAAARKALADAQAAYQAQRQLGAQHRQTTLRAPFAGVVVAVSASQGDRVQAGAPLLQLAHTSSLVAPLGIDPEDSGQVRPGMAVHLHSVFTPDVRIDGRIVQRQMAIDPQSHLVDMLARFTPAPGQQWAIGVPVRGEIVLESRPEWTLPRQAVLTDGRGAYIYQVKDGKAHLVRVTTHGESAGTIAVRGGFDPAQPVVVVGNYELHEGMAVREEKQ